MSGKFVNTTYTTIIDSLTKGFTDKLKNPYYLFIDKDGTIVEYYRQNIEASTLDEALKIHQAYLSNGSPIRFNLIQDFILYGLEKITTTLNVDDYGLEAESIEGEAIFLPNSIIPIPGDYFRITYTDKHYLFQITSSTMDTLENGANFYKAGYKYNDQEDDAIFDQIIGSYRMYANNIGTDYRVVISSTEADYIQQLEYLLDTLRNYYTHLFYNDRVETFTVTNNGYNLYDPNMIEFLMRNNILSGNSKKLNVTHQLKLPASFQLDYDQTFFKSMELCDPTKINRRMFSQPYEINQLLSTFSMRKEQYFSIDKHVGVSSIMTIKLFDEDLFDAIKYNYRTAIPSLNNLIVKSFYKEAFNSQDLSLLDDIEYQSNLSLFYMIPFIIFSIESIIKAILTGEMPLPKIRLSKEPTEVTYGSTIVKQYNDTLFTYFVGTIGNSWIVNRYNKDNNMSIGITTIEPLSLFDCQQISYTAT